MLSFTCLFASCLGALHERNSLEAVLRSAASLLNKVAHRCGWESANTKSRNAGVSDGTGSNFGRINIDGHGKPKEMSPCTEFKGPQ